MSVTTSQQISRYFEQFQTVQVAFTKETISATLLNTKQVFIKCLGYQWPCIIYSSSMTSAKVIANIDKNLKESLQKSNNVVQLRFSFLQPEKTNPITFFVGARVAGFAPYKPENPQLNFVNLEFTQHPPDTLIEILGSLQEAVLNASRRKEERVLINPDTTKKLGLLPKNTVLSVDRVPRKCILRDLSFSGAKVIIHGVPQFLLKKPMTLRLEFEDPRDVIQLVGTIIRFEPIEGRSDIAAFAVLFEEDAVPVNYKVRLNAYVRTLRAPKQSDSQE